MDSNYYPLPHANDGDEFRLNLQHEIFRQTLDGRLLNAPVAEPVGRVLDIGAGSGVWAAEFATEHPTAEVVGMDHFIPTVAAPSNCRFLIQDAEKDWEEIGDLKFDVIHTRMVLFHVKDVRGLLRRCYEHLKPGGYIDLQEFWLPYYTDEPPEAPEHSSKVLEWGQLRLKAASQIGIDQTIAGQFPDILSEIGFADVQTLDYKWPIGPWMEDDKMKDIGGMFLQSMQLGKMGFSQKLLAILGMDEGQINDYVEQVGKELGVGKLYTIVRFAWATKPE